MRQAYHLLIAVNANDDKIDAYVDAELRCRPVGALASVTRLN